MRFLDRIAAWWLRRRGWLVSNDSRDKLMLELEPTVKTQWCVTSSGFCYDTLDAALKHGDYGNIREDVYALCKDGRYWLLERKPVLRYNPASHYRMIK